MNLKEIHSVYFVGIGGIGMSAIARWFNKNGYTVAGYDKTATPLTDELQAEGMKIHFNDDTSKVEGLDKSNTLVVYTPAIPKNHGELNYLKDNEYTVLKRSEVLGLLTKDMFSIGVAGTHGKTTTSSMIAHILKYAGKNCVGFLGGITQNYNSNLVMGDGDNETIVVVEADEFDRSFLKLNPDIAIITCVDADHLDIYDNEEEFNNTFRAFANVIKDGGSLIYNKNITIGFNNKSVTETSYGLENGKNKGSNVQVEEGAFVFDFDNGEVKIEGLKLYMPGYHNVENAIGAISACLQVGVEGDVIKTALEEYGGVKRRFEYHIRHENLVYIDDYAHHPTEINALVKAVRAMYPSKKITAVFQPHLYSRTSDFMEGFAQSLSQVDELILMDIYPARELPMEGVTSDVLLEKITIENKVLCTKKTVMDKVAKVNTDVLLTVGAGDIDEFVEPIKQMLLEKSYA